MTGKSPDEDARRLYSDLAWTWPIISPPEEYIEESEYFIRLILEQSEIEVKTLLNLGCGGGHNDFTLKKRFDVTGVDVSGQMLDLARRLNPEVNYIREDMRSVRLGKAFDAVVIFDSINYMLTEEDLHAAFKTAFEHLEQGGVFLTIVEETPESLRRNNTVCTYHASGDTGIWFVENTYDPDPSDNIYEATFVYIIRRDGRLEIETDRHTCGIFGLETWRRQMEKAGLEIRKTESFAPASGERTYPVFVCLKPT